MTSTSRFPGWLALGALALGASACHQADRLLLLDVRASGGLPTTVSAVRFSATGWPTRSVAGVLGPGSLLFGYYGPSGSGPVTVTAEAIDAASCVVGTGSATVLDTSSGQTAPATVLYVRPLLGTNCALPDAGAGGDAGNTEAGADADAGTDAGANVDVAADAGSPSDAAGVDAITGADGDAADATGASDASPG